MRATSLLRRRPNARPPRARRSALLAAAAAAAALTLPAAPAVAATYDVWSCHGPDGSPVSARAWQQGGSAIAQLSDACASGGTLTVAVPAGRNGTYLDDAGARFQTLGGGEIVAYRLWRWTTTAGSGSVAGAGFYTDVLEDDFGFASTGVDGCYRASGCPGLGVPGDPGAPTSLVAQTGVSLHSVSIAAGCSAPISGGARCLDGGTTNAAFHLWRAQLELSDPAPPTLVGARGALLDGAPVGGVQTVALDAADAHAGVRAAEARVDGALVAVAEAGGDCREPYTRPAPCPGATTLTLRIDTAALADGAHQLEIALRDGAGNTAAVLRQAVAVENAPPAPPAERGPSDPPPAGPPPVVIEREPDVAVRGDYRVRLSQRRVAAGARRSLRGRVTARDGSPVAGAALVLERRRFGPFGGDWREAGTLRASASGRFRVAVPRRAQQLRVRLLPPQAANTSFVSAPTAVVSRLRLRVAARPRALRNGRMLRLVGRVANANGAARGKHVLVQAVVGGHWTTVDRVRARRSGAFVWRYRFQRTRDDALYSFRVVVARDGDRWPWAPATSSPLRVRVRP